jgi:hypothetical protein
MKIIQLTGFSSNAKIFINIAHIGHFSRYTETSKMLPPASYTIVGVTTHNNGGFRVIETPEQVIELMKNAETI